MTEKEFQTEFIEEGFKRFPNHVFVPFLELKYEIGKYHKGKEFGVPDTVPDVIEFDEKDNFHLWELKRIENPEAWNGKFFGQIMLYDFLFSTEPWNELLGRLIMRDKKPNNGIKGDIGKIISHLASFGDGAKDEDKKAHFKTWNLVVCGGDGYEIAAGYNPVAWSFWVMGDEYFSDEKPAFYFHQFYRDDQSWELVTLPNSSVISGDGLTQYSLDKFSQLNDENDNNKS